MQDGLIGDREQMRRVVLYGRNVASYKFALSKSLMELAAQQVETVSLSDLAVPFAKHICEHLKGCDRQATSRSSRFLDACRFHNAGKISATELVDATSQLGFNNVIDAFHVVGDGDIETRFFIDERQTSVRGIRLTDSLLMMCQDDDVVSDLTAESEARWRLVESAWETSASGEMLRILYDSPNEVLMPAILGKRRPITEVRPALNGYQKGFCFYCFAPISVLADAGELSSDVDHFYPFSLGARGLPHDLDEVWNLVLPCKAWNRGSGGKFASLPSPDYLPRLHHRNERLIASHHPLRETLIKHTGTTTHHRASFLKSIGRDAIAISGSTRSWTAPQEREPRF